MNSDDEGGGGGGPRGLLYVLGGIVMVRNQAAKARVTKAQRNVG